MDFDEAIEQSIISFYSGKKMKALEELKGEKLKYNLEYFESVNVDEIKNNPEKIEEPTEEEANEKI